MKNRTRGLEKKWFRDDYESLGKNANDNMIWYNKMGRYGAPDDPRISGKFGHLPLQLLSFVQGRKN